MADIKVELKNSLNSKIYPKTTLDNIVKSVASSTTLIASGGVIKKDFLDLTGLISSSYVSSANIIPTSAVSGFDTAVKNAASTYVNSNSVIPQSAVSGLSTALGGKMGTNYEDYIQLGQWLEWQNDNEIGLARYHAITTVTGASVYIQPGEAYVIDATTTSKTLNVGSVPSGYFGLESHMEIFVANTGYIVTGTNVILAQPLEPDSVNNCTIRFHDGFAIISVEDHVAGYIVVSSGSASNTSGTLAYGLTNASSNYIAFDGRLNGSVISFGGVTANGKKHVVGNGYDNTILTGTVNCGTSKFTVANLSLQNITVNGGTLTLGDTLVQGEVTAATSNGIAIEKATVTAGGTISNFYLEDGGRLTCSSGGIMQSNKNIYFFSTPVGTGNTVVFISGGTVPNGFGLRVPARGTNRKQPVAILDGITFYGNAQLLVYQGSITSASNCDFTSTTGYAIDGNTPLEVTLADCSFNSFRLNGGTYNLIGSSFLQGTIAMAAGGGTLNIADGAALDMTGNAKATPIAMGGGVVIGSNVHIYPSAGSASAVEISGGTYAKITKGGVLMGPVGISNGEEIVGGTNTVIDLDGTHVVLSSGQSAFASGCVFSGGSDPTTVNAGGAFSVRAQNAQVKIVSCTLVGNSANTGAAIALYQSNAKCIASDCLISGNTGAFGDICALEGSVVSVYGGTCNIVSIRGATMYIEGDTKIGNIYPVGSGGNVVVSSGAIVDLTGNPNATPINPGGGITFEQGGATVLYSSGAVSGSYSMDNVTLPAGAKLTNTNVIDLGLTNVSIAFGAIGSASGCVFSGGSATNGGAIFVSKGGKLSVTSCSFTSNTATNSGGAIYNNSGTCLISNCEFSGNNATTYGLAVLNTAGVVYLNGCAFGAGQSVTNTGAGAVAIVSGSCAVGGTLNKLGAYGTLLISAGAVIDATGNTNNTIIIQSAGGCKVGSGTPDNWVVNGSATFINSAGAEVTLSGTFVSVTKAGVVS